MSTFTTQKTQAQIPFWNTSLHSTKRERLTGIWIKVDGKLAWKWTMTDD